MKSLFTLLLACTVSLSLMGQQDNKELKDIKELMDLKEQRYTKKHRTGQTAPERQRPGNSENPSRDYPRQFQHKRGSSLKTGNSSEQKMDSVRWELYDAGSSSWILNDRELFSYDSEGNMTTYVWFAYDSAEMKILPYDKEVVKHDDAGNPTEIIWLIWDIESSQWVNWAKYTLSYDGEGNQIQETISDWDPDGNQWLEGARFEMTYDASANLLLEIWSFWDEDELEIVQAYQKEYLYEDGNLTTLNEYGREEGDWVLFFKTNYEYYISGNLKFTISANLKEELTQAWTGQIWIDYSKIIYTLNENERLILEEIWEFDFIQTIMVLARQYGYVWDTDGNRTVKVVEHWNEESTKGTNSWQNSLKSEWTVNKDFNIGDLYVPYWFYMDDSNLNFVHMPVSELSYIYEGEDWVMDSRQSAYYSDFGSSTGFEELEEMDVKVFPIPAAEQLTFSWEDSYGSLNLELYDLTGKLVISRSIDNNEIIAVDQLPGGIYLYKLIDNTHPIHGGKISIE